MQALIKCLTVIHLITPSSTACSKIPSFHRRPTSFCILHSSFCLPSRRPSDSAQLRQERNPCSNQSQRSSSPVAGGMFTGHHSSSGHTETLANGGQGEPGPAALPATPESMKSTILLTDPCMLIFVFKVVGAHGVTRPTSI